MALTRTSTSPAVTVAEAKAHLRIDGTSENELLQGYILAATEFVESHCFITLVESEYVLSLDSFPAARQIKIPRPPLLEVAAVKYFDTAGTLQTLDPSTYTVDAASQPGRVVLNPSCSWPSTSSVVNAVRVEFTAGPEAAPQLLKQCVLLMVGQFYERREGTISGTIIAEVPLAVQSIINLCAFPEVAG